MRACLVCGSVSTSARCPAHALRAHPRGASFQRVRVRIAERDDWRCGICGEPINPLLRKPHLRALAIDHIVPLAHGGGDEDANLRAAHALCNMTRGNRAA